MDEDMGDLDLGELDLLGLEDACKKHAFHMIAPKQIHLLKEVLNKSKLCGQTWDTKQPTN
jgi:hypothetical protein